MKPTFKTTALAILVSLGAVACSSTSSGDHPLSKQSIQDNNKSEAEQKRLEEEAKIKAEEAQKAKDLEEKARLEREAKERAEEAKRLEEARIQAELNKMPKTMGILVNFGKNLDSSFSTSDFSEKYRFFPYGRTEALYKDINEAIKNDIQKGGKYIGLHKGSYKSTLSHDFPKVIELDDKSFEHGSNKLIAKKIDYNNKDINYLIINNPYSRYGALFVDRYNSDLLTESFTDQDYNFKAGYYIKDGIQYNMESLQGKTFAYKGNIIAVARRAIPNTNVTVNDEPTVDGDIAFKIKFKEKADSNELFDLVINSKLLGNNINAKNFDGISPCTSSDGFCGGYLSYNDNEHIDKRFISLTIVDKDANDIAGQIEASFKEEKENGLYSDKLPENGLLEYKGVFGATKQ